MIRRIIRRWWHKRQRAIDIDCLWPMCKEQAAGDLHTAHEMFFLHAWNDEAWHTHYGDSDLWQTIQRMK